MTLAHFRAPLANFREEKSIFGNENTPATLNLTLASYLPEPYFFIVIKIDHTTFLLSLKLNILFVVDPPSLS